MSSSVRRRLVAGALVALTVLGVAAIPASAQDPAPTLTGRGGFAVTARFEGTKGPAPQGRLTPTPRAVGDVTINSLGCTPDPVGFGAQTTCSFQAQNQTTTATDVDLSATGDSELTVTGATLGAATSGGTASVSGVPLPPRTSSRIAVNVGSTPAGFTPLSTAGIPPTVITDDQFLNVNVPEFRWDGNVYNRLGVSANGYVVVGGGESAKDATATPQDMPNPGRPNNVLAPFWTDLTPAGGGTFTLGYVVPGGSPVCDRPVWIVAEWQLFEYGTATSRKTQVWIESEDPECVTSSAPAEAVYFTYDHTTMTAAPARPFRIGAESIGGTAGGMRPAGELPTQNYRVTSSATAAPAPVVQWDVVATGTAAGTGTIAATVASSLIPGSSTVFADVTVEGEAAPTVTDDPDPTTVTAGQQAVFSAAATGAGSVAWEVSTDDGGTWNPVPGASATTLAFTAGGGDDGNQYRAVFSNPSGTASATSTAATLTVEAIATSVAVVPSPAAPTSGQAVTFTATVAPAGATGTVQFAVDGTPLGAPVAVAGGTATSPATSTLTPGDHTVTAVYSGDADHAGSTGTGGVSVDKIATTVDVDLSPDAPFVGQPVTFTASVSPTSATGTVQFTVDGNPLGSPVTVSGGTAVSPPATGLERGSHVVVAQYSGDATRGMATSGPVDFTVARRSTSTGVTVRPAAPNRGDEITFEATVSPTPNGGTVQFAVDGNPVGAPVAVDAGLAVSAPVDLPAGDHAVTVAFSGDEGFLPSTSAAVVFTVARRASTSTIVAVRPDVIADGDDVVVDVAVVPVPVGGTVQMQVDGSDVGAPLALDASGEVTATIPGLAVGAHDVAATFSGDVDLLPSDDSVTVTVHTLDEAAVLRAFNVLLGRPAEPAGQAYWLDVLEGGATFEQVARRIALSAEGRGRLVDQFFLRVLGRAPEADGRAYWIDRLGHGLTAERLLAFLIASPESYQRSGGSAQGTALTLFRVHTGRAANTADLLYWTGRIAAANTPAGRERVALAFGRSDEATAVAVRIALGLACGSTSATAEQVDALGARWAAIGRNPIVLIGSALTLVCPPGT